LPHGDPGVEYVPEKHLHVVVHEAVDLTDRAPPEVVHGQVPHAGSGGVDAQHPQVRVDEVEPYRD
jgi:hypothetical protein